MFERLKAKSTGLLGIDVSSTSIKLVELKRSSKGFSVVAYAWHPLPEGAIVEKQIVNINQVSAAIRAAVKTSKTRQKNAVVAVNSSLAIQKWVDMDASLGVRDLESQVQVEADQYIPYSLDEVEMDFVVGKPLANDPSRVSVLVVACRKEDVKIREQVLSMAGLNAVIVDVESYAMERAYPLVVEQIVGYQSDDTVAVIDVGETITTFTVLQRGSTIYTREQAFGGRDLNEKIMSSYNLSYQDAELAKKKGNLAGKYQQELLPDFIHSLTQQILRSLTFFYSATAHTKVSHIILAGGSSLLPGLCEAVAKIADVPTILADPCKRMSVAKSVDVDLLSAHAPVLMIACGLAMREGDGDAQY